MGVPYKELCALIEKGRQGLQPGADERGKGGTSAGGWVHQQSAGLLSGGGMKYQQSSVLAGQSTCPSMVS